MISSNTIIHFTKTKKALAGILSENFRVFYCRENFKLGEVNYAMRVPMVSFCDIPLSQIHEHLGKYGCYGIGLTREWAERNCLNPVLYLDSKSYLSASLVKVFEAFVRDAKKSHAAQRNLLDVLRYIKNFQGKLQRGSKVIERYRFADEREWRYVPSVDELLDFMVAEMDYKEEKRIYDDALAGLRLSFEPNDIKYIVINSDDEISEFVNILQAAKGNKYSFSDVQRLTTRILTAEQIKEDM